MSKVNMTIRINKDAHDKLKKFKAEINKNRSSHKITINQIINLAVGQLLYQNNNYSINQLPTKKVKKHNIEFNHLLEAIEGLRVNFKNYNNNINQIAYKLNVDTYENHLKAEKVRKYQLDAENNSKCIKNKVEPKTINLLNKMYKKVDRRCI